MSKPDILSFLNDEFLMPQPEVLEHSLRESPFYWYSKRMCLSRKKSTLGSRGSCIIGE